VRYRAAQADQRPKEEGQNGMSDSQEKVMEWLLTHPGWWRPGQMKPDNYAGGPSAIGRVLRSLLDVGLIDRRKQDRGNGTACFEYQLRRKGKPYERPPG
jgi:hypothetical protein